MTVAKIVRLSLLVLLASGCGGARRHLPIPISSPDGSMTLHTRIEPSGGDPVTYKCVVFEIHDRSGRILHAENTRASDYMGWNMSWVADDRIRLDISDIGTREWSKQADGTWVNQQPTGSSFGDRP